ncbi:GNAT family N-acetyltransferase [Rhodovulum adriaticum]|uniref:L-amino acid N-acyltransferase YncA n=1 Tax=Rhodovulum adriaticum TaxID=35804 RepID=A0A4R2NZC3_RHOAD|nr:GNAT family N-acetyltransferase [Rhodovulum adriaticum]MBK1636144.1 hypothetical protein [Rhodovulum adriaticum]TCP27527.1 L-amino acid N-acyltransferase YncA [Rhodovulum adriaticum]
MIAVRPAQAADAPQIAALLNAIIAAGGTTAMETPLKEAGLAKRIVATPDRSCWHVAQDGTGRLVGVQWAEPHPGLPADMADIATFTRIGMTGCGIGTALFQATQAACRARGYRALNAAIRAENIGGLRFYESLGFTDWQVAHDARLASGKVTGKWFKRIDL